MKLGMTFWIEIQINLSLYSIRHLTIKLYTNENNKIFYTN